MSAARVTGRSVVIVGAGGNIGSHLVPHLARMPGVRRLTLVDPDAYGEGNLAGQDIVRRDVGRPKVRVQARRIRQIDHTIGVIAIAQAVEHVPLGLLGGDVLLACVDSRAARRAINACAWRLGVPWIDAGVLGEGLLARVNVYVPGPRQPCLECAWDARDYGGLEQAYPCTTREAAAPTNAPSALGALAAALQALECQKLLAARWEHLAVARQVTISALGHRHFVTTFATNPRCRFDHETWTIERVDRRPEQLTLAQVCALGQRALGTRDVVGLHVVEQVFVRKLACPGCGAGRTLPPFLLGRLTAAEGACDRCGQRMRAPGFDVLEWLREADLPPATRQASLRGLGVRTGDVCRVGERGNAACFQIGGVP